MFIDCTDGSYLSYALYLDSMKSSLGVRLQGWVKIIQGLKTSVPRVPRAPIMPDMKDFQGARTERVAEEKRK